MKKVYLESNKKLEARLWIPEQNSRNAIIIAHSFRNNMDELACSEAEKIFFEKGYGVLNFNFLGHGKSKGRLRDVSYKTLSENVSSAVKYMEERGFQKIGIYAISIGAIASVLSSKKPNFQVFLSPTPLYNPKGLLERYKSSINFQELEKKGYSLAMSGSGRGGFEMGKEWINEMQNENGKILKNYIKNKIPTLIIQGTNDPSYNSDKIKKFLKASSYPDSQDEYYEIQNADHNFTNEAYRKIAIERALNWFEKKFEKRFVN